MRPGELQALRLIGFGLCGFAAFQAAQERWAAVGANLGLLLVFSAVVVWRSRRAADAGVQSVDDEPRTRRLIARFLPVLLVFFVALAVFNIIHRDWFGAAWAAVTFGVALVGLEMNRRRLAEIQPPSKDDEALS